MDKSNLVNLLLAQFTFQETHRSDDARSQSDILCQSGFMDAICDALRRVHKLARLLSDDIRMVDEAPVRVRSL